MDCLLKRILSTQFSNFMPFSCADNCIYRSKNVSGRNFIGNEVEECKNLSGLFGTYPFKKGYINNWDTQKQILDCVLGGYLNSVRFCVLLPIAEF